MAGGCHWVEKIVWTENQRRKRETPFLGPGFLLWSWPPPKTKTTKVITRTKLERQRGQDGNGRGYERAAGKSLLKLHFLRPASSHRRPRRTTASKGVLKPIKVETWHHKCHPLLDQTLLRFLRALFSTGPCLLGTAFTPALSYFRTIRSPIGIWSPWRSDWVSHHPPAPSLPWL